MNEDALTVGWDLGCDLLGDVLTVVPPKSIARAMCVAKSWRDAVKARPRLHMVVRLEKAWRCGRVRRKTIDAFEPVGLGACDSHCVSSGGDLVAASDGDSIAIFSLVSRNIVATFEGCFDYSCFVGSILFGCWGDKLFGWDSMLDVNPFFSAKTFDTPVGSNLEIVSTAIAGSASHIALGVSIGCIKTWRVGIWSEHGRLTGHIGHVTSLVFVRTGLASSSRDGTIRVWRVSTCECLKVFDTLRIVSFMATSTLDSIDVLVYGSRGGDAIILLGLEGGEDLGVYGGPETNLTNIVGNHSRVVSVCSDKLVVVWDLQEKMEAIRVVGSLCFDVLCAWIHEDSLVTLNRIGRLKIWDFSTALE